MLVSILRSQVQLVKTVYSLASRNSARALQIVTVPCSCFIFKEVRPKCLQFLLIAGKYCFLQPVDFCSEIHWTKSAWLGITQIFFKPNSLHAGPCRLIACDCIPLYWQMLCWDVSATSFSNLYSVNISNCL